MARAMIKADAKVIRLDLRVPNALHDQLISIASANGAPNYRNTSRATLTPNVIKLIRLGIRQLSGNYQMLSDDMEVDPLIIENMVHQSLINLEVPSRGEIDAIKTRLDGLGSHK